MVCLVSL